MEDFALDRDIYKLDHFDFSLIEAHGKDAKRFLNGQVTADVSMLLNTQALLSSQTDRNGRILYAFYILKKSDESFFLLVKKEEAVKFIQGLEKFIIMDDVNLRMIDSQVKILIGGGLTFQNLKKEGLESYNTQILAYPALILIENKEKKWAIDYPTLSKKRRDKLILLTGSDFFGEGFPKSKLINQTSFMLNSVNLKKGCFIGQETICKIENNRGAAHFPCLLKLEKDLFDPEVQFLINDEEYEKVDFLKFKEFDFLRLSLPRELRVQSLKVKVSQRGVKDYYGLIEMLPFLKDQTSEVISTNFYYSAVEMFQRGDEREAESLFRLSIQSNHKNQDAYESLGVLLGRNNRFEESINFMDKLLELDPDSVMAHTNKSLFLMKLGKIEEAEEEKSLATMSSFKMFGKEAANKKQMEEQLLKDQAELKRKKSMFKEVLEIDQDDLIANFGLGEISYKEKNFGAAKSYLKKVLSIDSGHSRGYLILGKVMEELKDVKSAISYYEEGIMIATKKGELMPANEMQSSLLGLKNLVTPV